MDSNAFPRKQWKPSFRKGVRSLGRWTLSFAAVLMILNSAGLWLSSPSSDLSEQNLQRINFEKFENDLSVNVYDTEEAYWGGLPVAKMGDTVLGYVDMFGSSDDVFLNGEEIHRGQTNRHHVERHEYAHILQRHFASKKAGVQPGSFNPLSNAKYLQELAILDIKLREVMPPVQDGVHTLIPGLESAAECYTEAMLLDADEEDLLRFFSPHYFEALKNENHRVVEPTCSDFQRAVALNYDLLY